MMKRQATIAAAVLFVMSIAPVANVASAMPVGNPLVIKNAAPADIETVRWRGRGAGWGFGAGLLGGAIIGGILAAPYYYGPGPYYAPVYAAPPPGDAVAYCMQRFRSYDPGSGTYLGFDGLRHPCP
ncbi:MAG: BA14K family protein [Xanthobacteraceae bacterium]